MSTFYTILTAIGKAKLANAVANGTTVNITQIAAGSGLNNDYYEPTESQLTLKAEVWRAGVNQVYNDSQNSNWIVVEGIIPTTTGGFTIREVGIFDNAGSMIAIGKYPMTYKPALAEGSGKDLVLKSILEVSNTSVVTLKIDPAIVLASRKYVDDEIIEHDTNSNAHPSIQAELDQKASGILKTYYPSPTTPGWYRVAECDRNVSSNAILNISHSGKATIQVETAPIYDANSVQITQLSYAKNSSSNVVSRARILYHPTDGKSYLEIYKEGSSNGSVNVEAINNNGWTLYESMQSGSIPLGYSSQEIWFSSGIVTAGDMKSGLVSCDEIAIARNSATASVLKMSNNYGDFGSYTNFADYAVVGNYGKSFLRWTKGSDRDRWFSVFATDTVENSQEALKVTYWGVISVPTYAKTVGATNRDLYVDNNGNFGYVSSIEASKMNISNIGDTSWIYSLAPKTFQYRKKDNEGNYLEEPDGNFTDGLIAEDVAIIKPDICYFDQTEEGQKLVGINYSQLIVPLLKEIQNLKAEIELLKAK